MAAVVITGASSGIGEATARVLAGHGHRLVLAARRLERLDALAAELAARTEVLTAATDVTDPAALAEVAARTRDRLGRIDVWINNAGVGQATPWWEESVGAIRQRLEINLTAPILAARTVIPYMLEQGGGHIINVASVAGHIGTSGIYSATKFGLRGHTESLRRELKPYGIHVSLVSPGFVRTEMTRELPFRMPPADLVGHAIARLIRRPRREVVVPGWYRILIALNRWMPWLADRIIVKTQGRRRAARPSGTGAAR